MKNAQYFFSYILLIVFSFISIFPFFWLILISLKSGAHIFDTTNFFSNITFQNYINIIDNYKFLKSIMNSFIISILSVIIVLPIGFLGGYYFSRSIKNSTNNNIFLVLLSTKIAPPIVFAIPIYILYIEVGLIDTMFGMTFLYVFANLAFTVWIAKNLVDEFSDDIEEASKIDGCNTLQSIFYIIMPSNLNGIFSICLIVFILSWNEFLFASILTRNETSTFTVHLTSYFGSRRIDWSGLSIASVLGSLFPLVLTIFFQKYLIKGLSFGKLN